MVKEGITKEVTKCQITGCDNPASGERMLVKILGSRKKRMLQLCQGHSLIACIEKKLTKLDGKKVNNK